jgi:hypothetical protein
LTPASPISNLDGYSLIAWNPENADLLVQYMEDYPNTLSPQARGKDDAGYWSAYKYAVLVLEEALLRYPEAPQATGWKAKLAYNLARAGDERSGQAYANLIENALNNGETDLDSLRSWFKTIEPRLNLYTVNLNPPESYKNSQLIQIEGPGTAFLRVLENSNGFTVTPLDANFNFTHPTPSQALLSDLNNDGADDLVIFPSHGESIYRLEPPQVFDISHEAIQPLPFQSGAVNFDLGIEFQNRWTIQTSPEGKHDLVFEGSTYRVCPVTLTFKYRWNGNNFEPLSKTFDIHPETLALALCRVIVDQAIEFWGPEAAIPLMEKLLPMWPPEQTENGAPIPADIRAAMSDEWNYRLGVYQALVGNYDQAISYLQKVAQQPTSPDSDWTVLAQEFLQTYGASPGKIYPACVATPYCAPAYALDYINSQFTTADSSDPLAKLAQFGVAPVSAGYFDYDLDGVKERWFTVRHRPLEMFEYWIIADTPGGPRLSLVGNFNTNNPELEFADNPSQPPVVNLAGTNFSLVRAPGTLEPGVLLLPASQPPPSRYELGYNADEKALLSGEDPLPIAWRLKGLPKVFCTYIRTCDRYLYFLGLANELAGNKTQAIAAYVSLWRDYPHSPFTTLARLKLAGLGLAPGASPTPTVTGTLPATLTPTLTPTPGPSSTPGVATPTPTLVGPTPYPPYP